MCTQNKHYHRPFKLKIQKIFIVTILIWHLQILLFHVRQDSTMMPCLPQGFRYSIRNGEVYLDPHTIVLSSRPVNIFFGSLRHPLIRHS